MATEIKNPVLRLLIYGHVWLALGAAAQVWWIGRVFFTENLRTVVFAGCGTFMIYGLMRFFRMPIPPAAGTHQLGWLWRYRKGMIICVALAGLLSLWAIAPLVPKVWSVLIVPCSISLLYVLPMNIAKGRLIGLRRIPFMKSLWIAIVWAAISVLLPMAASNGPVPLLSVVLLFTMQTTFIHSLMIPFDMRDKPHDLPSLRTIPQVLGDRHALQFAIVLGLVPVVILFYFLVMTMQKGLPVLLYVLPMVGFVLSTVLVAKAGPQRSEAYYLFWLDGMLVLIPLLAWIGGLL